MKIPINIPFVGEEEISVVTSILKNGALTSSANQGGKYVQDFEKSVSSFVNSKYTVAVNSGTAALQSALYALDIKFGDEVIIPSFTFVSTANSVTSTGAKPVFVDILKENFTMDPDDLEKKITKKTKAIIPVHLYGNVAYLDKISEKDKETIEILKTMREDEDIHAQQAVDNGGEELKIPAKKIMKYTAKVMTSTSTHI